MATTAATRKRTVRDPFVGPYATQINQAAASTGVDPWELAAVLKNESGFDPKADNGADRGIAQINRAAHPGVTDAQAFNPAFAIPWAASYLRQLETAAGSWTGALRAYNTGNPKPSTAGDSYVARVEGAYRSLRSSVGAYVFPVTGAYSFGRLDQGVDLKGTPGQHAVAIGNGVVDAVKSDPGGFGQAIYLTLTGGAMDGQQIYYGHAQADVKPGQRVAAGDPVATLLQTPLGNATQPGWLEVGFAAGGAPVSKSPSDTASAAKFNAWIGNLSAPPAGTTGSSGGAQDASFPLPLPGFLPGFGPSIPIPGVNLPDPFQGISDVAGLLKKLFNDPAGTLGGAVLFLALMLLGFALIYLGITRLLGTKPIPSVVPVPV